MMTNGYFPRGMTGAVTEAPTLTQALCLLVEQLARAGDDDAGGRCDPAIDRWADADYIYLQADLPYTDGPEADVSIQSGHIFIRVAQQAADAGRTTAPGG
jgi:hypothetical protein